MARESLAEHGQTLTAPAGKVIGFLDSKAEFEAFTEALRTAGYPASKITSLYGDDGIHLLEQLREHTFFFGDSEDSVIQLSLKELKLGHYSVAIEVAGHQQAEELASLANHHGGHSFSYFGTWVSEQLSK